MILDTGCNRFGRTTGLSAAGSGHNVTPWMHGLALPFSRRWLAAHQGAWIEALPGRAEHVSGIA
jgi:hypothetical protein